MHHSKNESWKLSKSSFIKGKQCAKYLFLDKHKKQEGTPPSKRLLALFRHGHEFEDRFRYSEFPEGINLRHELESSFAYYNSKTRQLLNERDQCTLFEAGIIEDDILILMDVLHKNANGTFDFYEVKLHNKISEVIWQDVRIQYYVCKQRFGLAINSFHIVHRDGENGWVTRDVLGELEIMVQGIEIEVEEFKRVLKLKSVPDIEMGEQCRDPYLCPFVGYCKRE